MKLLRCAIHCALAGTVGFFFQADFPMATKAG